MDANRDPMGRAIADYHVRGKAHRLRVFSPMFDEDEIPVPMLFRTYADMPTLERRALDLARGRVLDVGAGAGCHTLELQRRGIDVTAIDISPLSVATMRQRGVNKVAQTDFFDLEGQYDTILMLMNGIGIVGTIRHLPEFFAHLDRVLAPGGQVLCDSSDISYVFRGDDGVLDYPGEGYYGELTYHMQYRDTVGDPFPWLFIDRDTLAAAAHQAGYSVQVVADGEHCDYLARITKQ